VYSAAEVNRILSAHTMLQIHEASRETCLHALEHAWKINKENIDLRNSIIHLDNSLELLFKSIILHKGKKYNKELQLNDCVEILQSDYKMVKKLAGQYKMLHEYRNRSYHHGDTPPENIVIWSTKLAIQTFKDMDNFDPQAELFKKQSLEKKS